MAGMASIQQNLQNQVNSLQLNTNTTLTGHTQAPSDSANTQPFAIPQNSFADCATRQCPQCHHILTSKTDILCGKCYSPVPLNGPTCDWCKEPFVGDDPVEVRARPKCLKCGKIQIHAISDINIQAEMQLKLDSHHNKYKMELTPFLKAHRVDPLLTISEPENKLFKAIAAGATNQPFAIMFKSAYEYVEGIIRFAAGNTGHYISGIPTEWTKLNVAPTSRSALPSLNTARGLKLSHGARLDRG